MDTASDDCKGCHHKHGNEDKSCSCGCKDSSSEVKVEPASEVKAEPATEVKS